MCRYTQPLVRDIMGVLNVQMQNVYDDLAIFFLTTGGLERELL